MVVAKAIEETRKVAILKMRLDDIATSKNLLENVLNLPRGKSRRRKYNAEGGERREFAEKKTFAIRCGYGRGSDDEGW